MNIEFIFDFASPNAFLAHRVIPKLEASSGLRFTYSPALLGGIFKLTNNRAPMEAFAGIKNKLAYMGIETRRFVAKHDITDYASNPFFPVNTLQLMRGAVYAHGQDFYADYIEAIFHHMWREPKKMDDLEVFSNALTESKLPTEQILAAIQDPEVKQQLIANTDAAVAKGVFGIPSFIVDGELFWGKDTLAEIASAYGG